MKTFSCPNCCQTIHIDHLDYDDYGGGCPICGEHFTFNHLALITQPAPKVERCEDAPCCGCCGG